MKDYLKHYTLKITALSPIHIGSGQKIGKKIYIYTPWDHKVIIPDIQKMYEDMQKHHLEKGFTEYMMDSRNRLPSLGQWLKEQGFTRKDYEQWKRYEMDAGEAFAQAGRNRPKDIDAFVKDAYGMPYIPGSSIKGMIRTALIAWEIDRNPEKFSRIKERIFQKSGERENRNYCLAREMSQLEQQVLYTLGLDEGNRGNAVNDNLSGLLVGDSRPIDMEYLTLSQKIDYTLQKQEKALPLLRESLKPETEICFDISIDTSVCPYTMEDIIEALNCFQKICYKYFYIRFDRGRDEDGIIWLGGGCGFLSKTIIYPLFGEDAVKVIDGIYRNTLGKNYQIHQHTKDMSLQLAPHVCKCTRYHGELYDMGMGRLEVV